MKALKASKRLVTAIIGFVLSLVLCIGVCLAWFAINDNVDANGLGFGTKGSNIKEFKITAYTLTHKTTNNGVTTFTVGSKIEDSPVAMKAYGGLVEEAPELETALLLKFEYEFHEALDLTYAVYANCKDTNGEIGSTGTGINLRLKCALSSVTDIYTVGDTETEESEKVTQKTEIEGEDKTGGVGSFITLKDGISDSSTSGVFYLIIDYDENEIFSQYFKALETVEGTSLSTPMDFLEDIEFYMGESTASE